MISKIKDSGSALITRLNGALRRVIDRKHFQGIIAIRDTLLERARSSEKERNRFLIIGIGSLLVLDYLMFCYHTDRNIFNIFPEIPIMEEKKEIDVYLPDLDGKTVFSEKREIVGFQSDERFVRYLFNTVRRGSRFENTSIMVPVDLQIRDIWITERDNSQAGERLCVVDVEVPTLNREITPVPGSESLFRDAFKQTVMANIAGITEVKILERGIPDKTLWEF